MQALILLYPNLSLVSPVEQTLTVRPRRPPSSLPVSLPVSLSVFLPVNAQDQELMDIELWQRMRDFMNQTQPPTGASEEEAKQWAKRQSESDTTLPPAMCVLSYDEIADYLHVHNAAPPGSAEATGASATAEGRGQKRARSGNGDDEQEGREDPMVLEGTGTSRRSGPDLWERVKKLMGFRGGSSSESRASKRRRG